MKKNYCTKCLPKKVEMVKTQTSKKYDFMADWVQYVYTCPKCGHSFERNK